MKQLRSGFTFIEVLACLLVVGLGLAAAVSLSFYCLVMSARAQGKATGMATALTVAIDPAPLMHTTATVNWKVAPGGNNSGIGTTTGWVNGYYVVRTESVGIQPCPGFTNDPVSVDVFGGVRGSLVASYTTWVMRQAFSP
jgi:prepilin-type N-terminal cleavage/methylation domain-containing protein